MAGGARATRRSLLAALLAASVLPPRVSQAANGSRGYLEDFELLRRTLGTRYAYLDAAAARRWAAAQPAARKAATTATSAAEWAGHLEAALSSFRDDHMTLVERALHPVRRVPADTDVWASWADGVARVESVRIGSDADALGVEPGHEIHRIEGRSIGDAVHALLGGDEDGVSRDWAVRRLLAGPWSGFFTIDVARGAAARRIEIPRRPPTVPTASPMAVRMVGEARDVAYLRVRNAFDDPALVREFDAALDAAPEARATILDLRDVNGEGDRATVRAVLGRFAQARTPWQVRIGRGGGRIVDTIEPRQPWPGRPVIALVDRWTAGPGEALAAGLAACGTLLVGTALAGLRGDAAIIRLPKSGLAVRYPAERTLLANGEPRESLRPAIAVDLSAPSAGPGDPILYQALKQAEALSSAPARRSAPG